MKRTSITLGIMAFSIFGLTWSRGATIFSESFGTVAATTSMAVHESANGFDNDSFTYSGSSDIRVTGSSSGYIGSSGDANVFITNTIGTNVVISDISTIGYQAGTFGLSYGAFKSATAADLTELMVEYSTNGMDWTALLVPAQPTGAGTASWRLMSLSSATSIPVSSTLSLRWRQTSGTSQFRIDDITFTGTAVPEPTTTLLGALGLFGILRRRR